MKGVLSVAVPPLAAFGVVACFFVVEAAGFRPMSNEPSNLSEAAAMGEAAAALRFIAAGQDPNTAFEISGGILGVLPRVAAAIDAAILGRREEMVPLLLGHGARVVDPHRTRCLAEVVDLPGILPVLNLAADDGPAASRHEGDDVIAACLGSAEIK